MLTSLAIHAIPMTLCMHIRWYTVPEQEHLPLEEQRFAPLAPTATWGDMLTNLMLNPILIYFCWLVGYGLVNFVFTSRVANYEMDSSYKTFTTIPSLRKKSRVLKALANADSFPSSALLLLLGAAHVGGADVPQLLLERRSVRRLVLLVVLLGRQLLHGLLQQKVRVPARQAHPAQGRSRRHAHNQNEWQARQQYQTAEARQCLIRVQQGCH
mmetsp:Transcript_37993/g.46407  ORF Transcript_37993/g.46407 Transcript_37993/m.46407 type:complete len:212 (+) Transcript_37993:1008-1643(+)